MTASVRSFLLYDHLNGNLLPSKWTLLDEKLYSCHGCCHDIPNSHKSFVKLFNVGSHHIFYMEYFTEYKQCHTINSFKVQNKCEGPISDGLYQAYSAAESVRRPVIGQKQKQPFNISLYITIYPILLKYKTSVQVLSLMVYTRRTVPLSLSGCLLLDRNRNNLSIYHFISYSFIVQNKCEGPISDCLYQAYSAAESVRMPIISQKQEQAFNISLNFLFFYNTK